MTSAGGTKPLPSTPLPLPPEEAANGGATPSTPTTHATPTTPLPPRPDQTKLAASGKLQSPSGVTVPVDKRPTRPVPQAPAQVQQQKQAQDKIVQLTEEVKRNLLFISSLFILFYLFIF